MPLILDLCGGTGSWSAPYARAGYDVEIIDPLRNFTVEEYLRRITNAFHVPKVHGILAAPPCTEFSSAGARHWATKDPALLDAAIATVRACYDIIQFLKPEWWALENPIGRMHECCSFIGEPKLTFHPWHYGDPWTKLTQIYGRFNPPPHIYERRAAGVDNERIHKMPGTVGRARLRSITPPRFAEAFFRSNP